ncbi:hypothetical protein [Geomonas anaerohicana]|uniref:Uncharacterized protein n=1 Tax=Geomonas anaerohicana TaxID=2798583 RepID=A0ABS0YD75_9BACT|nr:hypothetical protein [Geomonas anaerohicana]MBJ6750249.1 hypothetical protein [Geomonas anaerohicana]
MVIYGRKISIKIDDRRFEALHDYARKEGITVSILLRHLVSRFLESQQRFSPSLQPELKDEL